MRLEKNPNKTRFRVLARHISFPIRRICEKAASCQGVRVHFRIIQNYLRTFKILKKTIDNKKYRSLFSFSYDGHFG